MKKLLALVAVSALSSTLAATQAQSASSTDCFGQKPTYVGTKGADTVYAGRRNPVVYTGKGNDTVYVEDDEDQNLYADTPPIYVCTGEGADRIIGGSVTKAHGGDGYDSAEIWACSSSGTLFKYEIVDVHTQEDCK